MKKQTQTGVLVASVVLAAFCLIVMIREDKGASKLAPPTQTKSAMRAVIDQYMSNHSRFPDKWLLTGSETISAKEQTAIATEKMILAMAESGQWPDQAHKDLLLHHRPPVALMVQGQMALNLHKSEGATRELYAVLVPEGEVRYHPQRAPMFMFNSVPYPFIYVPAMDMPEALFESCFMHEIGHADSYFRHNKGALAPLMSADWIDEELHMYRPQVEFLDQKASGQLRQLVKKIVGRAPSNPDRQSWQLAVLNGLQLGDLLECDRMFNAQKVGRETARTMATILPLSIIIGLERVEPKATKEEQIQLYKWFVEQIAN